MRSVLIGGVAVVVLSSGSASPRAQSLAAFTAEDMLKVATASVLDVTEAETIDFENRMVVWYDSHLKAESRPPTTQER